MTITRAASRAMSRLTTVL